MLPSLIKNLSLLNKNLLTFVFLCLIFSTGLNAKIYKHVDKNGKVTYSDKPIDETSKKLNVSTEVNNKERVEAQERARKLISSKKRLMDNLKADKEEQLKKQKQQEENNKLCNQAKNALKTLEMQIRLAETNPDGKSEIISDEKREKYKAELRAAINENCN